MPVRTSTLDVAGAATRCWSYGREDAARRVVFLHGFRGDHHGLEPICAHLVGSDDDVQVLVPDLPGFGMSPPLPTAAHDVDGYAAWAHALLAAHPGAVLAGHSFGSIVAAAAAAGRTDLPGLVLVNPIATAALAGPRAVLSRLTALLHQLAGALPEQAGTALLRHPLLTRVASSAMATTSDPALRRWIHAEHGRYFSTFADRRVLLEAFGASVGHDVTEFAAAIPARTLLIAAERDAIAPLTAQRRLRALFPDARLVEVAGTGHLSHYETPSAVADAIREFLT